MQPDLDPYRLVLFDLDGVLTPTAEIHMLAWKTMFTKLFAEKGVEEPYADEDYFRYLDGKKRDDGVASLLASRGITVPLGHPDDPTTLDTVWGIGNRKNDVFTEVLRTDGIQPYPGSLALVQQLADAGMPMGVVSSSKNAVWVLEAAGIRDYFPVVIDGVVAADEGLASKPAPDMFLAGAQYFDIPPAETVVFEDATSGVAAAHAGAFGLVIGVDRGTGAQNLLDAGAHRVIDDLDEYVTSTGVTTFGKAE
ncbi:HAD family hydrolase [Naasia lichenicola]|uniref:Beta-phosphoglucomutase n=1 Tax=Naasia lichenicola TaxID=2565933 RepID=A0A4S4FRQ3_9MICO|nr:beta-phosphoglucomutase family hydrolase [Naasia lichenicola]THG33350.1 beta-phosphoglucomutase family hydrolase [Naasia lichenicola]